MRVFKMSKFIKDSTLTREVINYRWTKSNGLQAEMWRGVWVKSEYTLKELLAGHNGYFIEV